MFTCLFSAKEIIFCTTLQVGHWVADLYQLMVLLVGKLTTGCSEQLMVVLTTECSCPLAIDPTLGARIWLSWVLLLLVEERLMHRAHGNGGQRTPRLST